MNIAQRLRDSAGKFPQAPAVIAPAGRDRAERAKYKQLTFEQLDRDSDRLARGLVRMGVVPGTRLVLMVRPGLEFISLTFALFKAGAVIVLIDPGMGRTNIFRCLAEVEPEGFVAIPLVQAIRHIRRRTFPKARLNVTVGRRWFWGGRTYQQLLGEEWTPFSVVDSLASDPAAVIFTSGSTGPPKGVLFEHGMFGAQVDLIRDFYGIEPGGIDLSGFPLFALFNAAMGITTVIPDMDPTRPANVDPAKVVEAIRDLNVTQAYGSPAMWDRVGRYCEVLAIQLPSLRRVLSAGAPVPLHVIERMRKVFTRKEDDIHTPYGATESLPVCSISGREVLNQTAPQTRRGAGTCVGKQFPEIDVKVIEMTDGPISSLREVHELPRREIGEIIVRGPSVTREYFRRPEATRDAKIPDGDRFWHRIGDVGYFDEHDLLWYCGRKAHVVETAEGLMFPDCCEAIFNQHPAVSRSALVGVGPKPQQQPVIIIELQKSDYDPKDGNTGSLTQELLELARANAKTANIHRILYHASFPVDTRHNVKIARLLLADWAEGVIHGAKGKSDRRVHSKVDKGLQEIAR